MDNTTTTFLVIMGAIFLAVPIGLGIAIAHDDKAKNKKQEDEYGPRLKAVITMLKDMNVPWRSYTLGNNRYALETDAVRVHDIMLTNGNSTARRIEITFVSEGRMETMMVRGDVHRQIETLMKLRRSHADIEAMKTVLAPPPQALPSPSGESQSPLSSASSPLGDDLKGLSRSGS